MGPRGVLCLGIPGSPPLLPLGFAASSCLHQPSWVQPDIPNIHSHLLDWREGFFAQMPTLFPDSPLASHPRISSSVSCGSLCGIPRAYLKPVLMLMLEANGTCGLSLTHLTVRAPSCHSLSWLTSYCLHCIAKRWVKLPPCQSKTA